MKWILELLKIHPNLRVTFQQESRAGSLTVLIHDTEAGLSITQVFGTKEINSLSVQRKLDNAVAALLRKW